MSVTRVYKAALGLTLVFAWVGCAGSTSNDDEVENSGGAAGDDNPGGGGAKGGVGGEKAPSPSPQGGKGGTAQPGTGGAAEPAGGNGGGGAAGGIGGVVGSGGSPSGNAGQGGSPTGSGGTASPGDEPGPALSSEQQDAAIAFWKSKLDRVAGRRENGQIVELALWEPIGADAPASRMTDEVLAKLLGFNKLRRLEIHHPNMTKEGAQVIRRLPSIEFLGFQYTANTNETLDPDFMLVATAHRERLKVLSLKHLFSQKGTSVHKLGVFPKLEYAVLDNMTAQSEGVQFLKQNPTIVGLEMHRTSISGAELKEIASALPKLKCFHLKKAGGSLSSADIANAFRNHPSLEVFWPHGISASLPNVQVVSNDNNGVFSKPCGNLRPVDKPDNTF
ncbi:MAG: hypothetical protein SF187_20765 [Deltaproteobacteria bacterium]|nr:hypothetical protein [Deltaproteobacteria bacterium]